MDYKPASYDVYKKILKFCRIFVLNVAVTNECKSFFWLNMPNLKTGPFGPANDFHRNSKGAGNPDSPCLLRRQCAAENIGGRPGIRLFMRFHCI